jgi:hypothetical protein
MGAVVLGFVIEVPVVNGFCHPNAAPAVYINIGRIKKQGGFCPQGGFQVIRQHEFQWLCLARRWGNELCAFMKPGIVHEEKGKATGEQKVFHKEICLLTIPDP